MPEIRLITFGNENGSKEGVYFTEDFDTASDDFIPPGVTINSDDIIEVNLPVHFPLDYILWRA